MSRLPSVYRPASLRCVTPCDGEHVGIGFDGDDGQTVRIRLSKADAIQLSDLIRSQSEDRSGMPRLAEVAIAKQTS